MRHESTDAEKRLWFHLRNSKLNGLKFRRQVPINGFIVDFCCLNPQLIVELDGGQHSDPEAIRYDRQRDAKLRELGFKLLRFSDIDALKETAVVLNTILRAVEK
jgi:very-short-patch-repair endonuclease